MMKGGLEGRQRDVRTTDALRGRRTAVPPSPLPSPSSENGDTFRDRLKVAKKNPARSDSLPFARWEGKVNARSSPEGRKTTSYSSPFAA